MGQARTTHQDALRHMVDIGIRLSSERDTTKLLEDILQAARDLTNADGGTIYSITDNNQLRFETLINDSLNLYLGGVSGDPIPFPNIPIYHDDGNPNTNALVAVAAATGEIINIEDAYNCSEYDLSAARSMDQKNGYHTLSVLTFPMKNHEGLLNGVLQLINAQEGDKVVPFKPPAIELVQTLTSMASVALNNRHLIDSMESLFQSLTRLIAKAIDEKSPYTGGHCRRVPELTMIFAEAVHNTEQGPLSTFRMTDADRYELSIAGWLHDCGKIATPEYVMDKATKLQTLYDRISLVDAKLEIAKRDLEIRFLKQIYQAERSGDDELCQRLHSELEQQLISIEEDRCFLHKINIGSEFMAPEDQQRVRHIGKDMQVAIGGEVQNLLSDDEMYNLSIAKGTLTAEERKIVNRHMDITLEMLEALPFPKHLRRVPEYAGGHHEKMDGTGYPRGLTREQMSVPARIMAIADIFEALSASDRPYKNAKKISECLYIMGKLKLSNHIDPDLFDIFIDHKVYLSFAERFLKAEQIDDIDYSKIPGYIPPESRQ
ncbi:phosphohydrolase [Pokkaliibacter plantistimulans]|uniref:Phosphohydrolase n=1 Tax=Proteobacteria bacterium 228 TaxID=2083153 RepID=A0A2S5KMQ7_9PROT|nr:HD family phosphohydrolase [Pokkaliibacter plantistimulans]PPC75943.1 phosphohydrolase [Pokkaliibacter plantistimulans]